MRLRTLRRRGQTATFFISTGRCGTQWLAQTLGDVYSDLAVVRHDPIGARYRPRRYFRQWSEAGRALSNPEAAGEVGFITETIRHKPYIDTGWASYAMLPWFIERFPGQVRLVHLVRHPVPTAVSYVAMDIYAPALRSDEWTEFAFLDPTDPGVVQTEYQARWPEMTAFERCLFWWTEANLYAEEILPRYPEVPSHKIRSEDMFGDQPDHLQALVDFLGLPWRPRVAEATERRVDRWRFTADEAIDPQLILEHPETVRLMGKYGYDMDGFATPGTTLWDSRKAVIQKPWRTDS